MSEVVVPENGCGVSSRAVRKWRFEDLLTFVEVIEAGSITAAAARLNLSKSVVSKRIQDLESALDVELFQRSIRQVKPTENGELLHAQVVPLIHGFDDALRRLSCHSDRLQGRLRIVAPIAVGTTYLGTAIAQFARSNPELTLAVDYDDSVVDLIENRYDLAIRMGQLGDSSLISRKLCDFRRTVCCSPVYAEERGLPEQILDLAHHVCIDHANINNKQIWEFENSALQKTSASVPMQGRVVANSYEAMRDMAIAGFGLVMLPHFIVAPSLLKGELIPVHLDETPTPHAIFAVYPATRHIAGKVRAFIDHLVVYFRRSHLHEVPNHLEDGERSLGPRLQA